MLRQIKELGGSLVREQTVLGKHLLLLIKIKRKVSAEVLLLKIVFMGDGYFSEGKELFEQSSEKIC